MPLSRSRAVLSRTAILLCTALCLVPRSSACSFTSSAGYTVHVDVILQRLVPSTNNCQWGYNYNVEFGYDIRFTGTNIPTSMYDLQGKISCGSSQLWFSLPTAGGTGSRTTGANVWTSSSDCATATLATFNCLSLSITISGPGLPSTTQTCAAAVLPIELIDMRAVDEGNTVLVEWSTASEQNSDLFLIERAADDLDFHPMASVPAAGNSTQMVRYSWTDPFPLSGLGFYRLKEVDLDGSVTYGPIVPVDRHGRDEIRIYPNPGRGGPLTIAGSTPAPGTVRVRELDGSLVAAPNTDGQRILLPPLAPGIYFICFRNTANDHLEFVRYVHQ